MANLAGTNGNDCISGTQGNDVIHGNRGNDTILGLGGADRLYGEAGNDTIEVGGVRVRLKGIAAPEMREPGGKEAKAYLLGLAEGQTVVCELTRERTCSVGGEDLAQLVIAAGLARDCPRYSGGRYASMELPLPDYCR